MAATTSRLVRLARLPDAAQIAALSRRVVEQGLNWRWRPGRIEHAIRASESTVIVSEDVGQISGFAVFGFGMTIAHLSLLAVNEQYRHRGVASTLLGWLLQSSRVAGVGRVSLEVRRDNKGAIAFYERHGFRRCGIKRGYYEGVEDAVSMQLYLIDPELESRRPG